MRGVFPKEEEEEEEEEEQGNSGRDGKDSTIVSTGSQDSVRAV